MGSNKGVLRLVDADLYRVSLYKRVFDAYAGTMEEPVLADMDVNTLRVLWDRRPNATESPSLVVEKIDPKDIHEARFSPDGKHIPNRRGGER